MSRPLSLLTILAAVIAFTATVADAMTPYALYQYQIGESARRAGKPEIAATHYQKALAADPTDSVLYLSLGQLLETQGNSQDALAVYEKGLSYNPRDILLNAASGRLYEVMGDNQASFERFNQLSDTKFADPSVFYFNTSEINGGVNQPKEVIVVDPKTGKQQITYRSFFPHQYVGYETYADKPQFAQLFETVGNVYTRMGQLNDAKAAYTMAVRIDPQGENHVYQKLANLAKLEGRKADEIRATNNYQAYVKLGTANVAVKSNNVSAKVVADNSVSQSQPLLRATDVTSARQLLSSAQTASGQQQVAQVFLATPSVSSNSLLVPQVLSEAPAVAKKFNAVTYDQMLKRLVTEPGNTSVMLSLANMDIDRSDWTEALYYLNQVVMRDPSNAQAYWLAAEAYQGLNEYSKAQGAYEKALAIEPNNTYMQSEYTAVLKRSGQWNAAKQYQDSNLVLPQVAARPVDQSAAAQAFPLLVPSNASSSITQSTVQSGRVVGYNQQGLPIIMLPSNTSLKDLAPRSFGNQSGVYVLP